MKLATPILIFLLLAPFVAAGEAQPGIDFMCGQERIESIGLEGGRPDYLDDGYTYEYDGEVWIPTNTAAQIGAHQMGIEVTGDTKTVRYTSNRTIDAFVTYEVGQGPDVKTVWNPGGKQGTFTSEGQIVAVFACYKISRVRNEPYPEPAEVPEFGVGAAITLFAVGGLALMGYRKK